MSTFGGRNTIQSAGHRGTRHAQRNILSAEEVALESACKRALKSRFFRGNYVERRYVECLRCYRDIVAVDSGEDELAKLLLDVNERLQLFYRDRAQMWTGITHGQLVNDAVLPGTVHTIIWTKLSDVAFGQYWFRIKSVHLRHNEMVISLKMARPVLPEDIEKTSTWNVIAQYIDNPSMAVASISAAVVSMSTSVASMSMAAVASIPTLTSSFNLKSFVPQNSLQQLIPALGRRCRTLQNGVGNFARQHITIAKVISAVRLIGLLIMLALCNMVRSVKYVGAFTLYFMMELCRISHVLQPVMRKGLELLNNIVFGFYALLLMIWNDILVMKTPIRTEEFERKSQ